MKIRHFSCLNFSGILRDFSKSVLHAVLVLSFIDTSVLEVSGSVSLPGSVPPVPGVVEPVELVVGEVVDDAPPVGDLGVAEPPAASYCPLVKTRV